MRSIDHRWIAVFAYAPLRHCTLADFSPGFLNRKTSSKARKTEEIQGYGDHNEWKDFFSMTKAVYSPPTKTTSPLLSTESSTLKIIQRWAEHFRGVLNCPYTISDAAFAHLTPMEINAKLSLLPSLHEAVGVVRRLSSGKASGSDAIPAETYKYGGPQLMDPLTSLFQAT
nr:unnamed protein product [Spirometra erinaceieuropaei]